MLSFTWWLMLSAHFQSPSLNKYSLKALLSPRACSGHWCFSHDQDTQDRPQPHGAKVLEENSERRAGEAAAILSVLLAAWEEQPWRPASAFTVAHTQ